MLKRLLVMFGVLAASLALMAIPASAQYSGPGTVITDGECTPGGAVTFTVTGAAPGSTVTLIFAGSVVLGTGIADADGTAVIHATWPDGATGTQTVVADGIDADGNPLDISASFACPPPPGVSPPGAVNLPRTGSDSLTWARLGLVLVIGGGLLVLFARKRSSAVHERV